MVRVQYLGQHRSIVSIAARCRMTGSAALLPIVWMAIFRNIYGYFLAMVSDGQVHVLNEGDSVVLECSFHADGYSLFDYPVLWRKTQRGEDVQMNIMGNINEPFASTNRFEVAFTSLAPRYKFELSILDATTFDSGNYTCEIRGPYSSILGQSTHYVFVRAAVQSLTLVDIDSTSALQTSPPKPLSTAAPTLSLLSHGPTTSAGSRVLRLVENQLGHIRCIAVGGYPPPTVEIQVDRRDATSDFALRSSVTVTGRRGLRMMTYRTERWSQSFRAKMSDHNLRLKCIATVQGLKPLVEYARLDIDYQPKVFCTHAEANINDMNACITCELHAKPPCTSIMWVIDQNKTTLNATGQASMDNFWTMSKELANGLVEVKLCLRLVESHSFQKYTLVAENAIAPVSTLTFLGEKVRTVNSVPLADSAVSNAAVNRTLLRDTSRKTSGGFPKQVDAGWKPIGRSVDNVISQPPSSSSTSSDGSFWITSDCICLQSMTVSLLLCLSLRFFRRFFILHFV